MARLVVVSSLSFLLVLWVVADPIPEGHGLAPAPEDPETAQQLAPDDQPEVGRSKRQTFNDYGGTDYNSNGNGKRGGCGRSRGNGGNGTNGNDPGGVVGSLGNIRNNRMRNQNMTGNFLGGGRNGGGGNRRRTGVKGQPKTPPTTLEITEPTDAPSDM